MTEFGHQGPGLNFDVSGVWVTWGMLRVGSLMCLGLKQDFEVYGFMLHGVRI